MNRERISMRTIPFPNFSVNGMPLSSDSGSYDTYLTITDVEKVTGLTGLKQVQFNPLRFLGSDLNFVASDGSKILSVEFSNARRYNTYKVFVPKNIKILLQAVGEEAFVGPDIENQVPYLLVFRQGNYAISLTAATTCDAQKNMLTLEQLISIGKIIASRLAKAA
jgi:hypothetical protein